MIQNQQVPQTDLSCPLKSESCLKSTPILKQLSSLQKKICQEQFSHSKVPQAINPSLDPATSTKILVITCLFLSSLHFKSESQIKLGAFKLIWVLSLFFYNYSFPPKNTQNLQKQLSTFFVLRLLSSSIIYSLVSGNQLTFQQHLKSQENDILVNVLLTILLAVAKKQSLTFLKNCVYIQFSGYLAVSVFLQIWFKKFEYTVFLQQILWFLALSLLYEFVDKSFNSQTKQLVQEDLSQEFNNIKQKIIEQEESHSNFSLSKSIIEDLAMKIKYLKFNLLQKENDKPFSEAVNRPIFSNTRRRTYMGPYPGPVSPHPDKRNHEPSFLDTPLSGYKLSSPSSSRVLGNNNAPIIPLVKNDMTGAQWKMVAEDCDNILKLLSSKSQPQLKEKSPISSSSVLLNKPFEITNNNHVWNHYLEENICNWNFDTLKFKEMTNGNHVVHFGNGIMKKFNIFQTLDTTPTIATSFLNDVSDGYLPNPYHNSIHGADVCNAVGYFLAQPEFGGKFSQLEIACTIISALVHDIGHPGLNNAFLMATLSTKALLYNDQSVLENFHTASFYKILQKSSSNILKNLNEKDSKYFRKLSISLILDTDLSKHVTIVNKFKTISEPLQLTEESERFLSLSVALKCADVSHGAKELGLHKKWSRRIIEEFYNQGDQERKLNIPVTPTCDRTGNISKGQTGFLNFIVTPLFEAFDQKFFTEEMKKTVTQQIQRNLQYWQSEIPHEEKGKSSFMEETSKVLKDIANESAEKSRQNQLELTL